MGSPVRPGGRRILFFPGRHITLLRPWPELVCVLHGNCHEQRNSNKNKAPSRGELYFLVLLGLFLFLYLFVIVERRDG